MGVQFADNIGLKGGHTSTIALLTLLLLYKIQDLDPTALMYLSCFFISFLNTVT